MDIVPIVVAIIAALASIITGGLTLIGVIVSSILTNKKMEQELDKKQAITDVKLDTLTTEVREHNNFARRMPVVEQQIKDILHRVDEIENKINK